MKSWGSKENVRGAVPIRRLEGMTNVAAVGEREPLGRDRRACDIACQMLELLSLTALCGYARMQRESRARGHARAGAIRIGRQRLEGEHFLPLTGSGRDSIRDRVAEERMDRCLLARIEGEIGVLDVARDEP